jgi:hypothetical protein
MDPNPAPKEDKLQADLSEYKAAQPAAAT